MKHVPSVLVCPYCLRMNDCTTSADPEFNGPEPGDVAVCWLCAYASKVNEHGQLRRLTPEELEYVKADDELQQYRWHILTSATPSEAVRRVQR